MNEAIEMNETVENVEAVEEIEKPYKFRKLCADDTFWMLKLIRKIGIKEFKTIFEGDKIDQLLDQSTKDDKINIEVFISSLGATVAFDIVDIITGNLADCDKEVFAILSRTTGLDEKKIRAFDFPMFIEMILDFVKKEEFKDFIKVVSRSFK